MRTATSDFYFGINRPDLDDTDPNLSGLRPREPLPLSNLQPLSRLNPPAYSTQPVRPKGKTATLQKVGATPGSTHISTPAAPAQGLSILELLRQLQGTQSGTTTPDPAKPKPLGQRRSKVSTGKSGMPVLRTKTRRSKNSLIN